MMVQKGSIDISKDEFGKLFPNHLIRIIALSKELMRALESSFNNPGFNFFSIVRDIFVLIYSMFI